MQVLFLYQSTNTPLGQLSSPIAVTPSTCYALAGICSILQANKPLYCFETATIERKHFLACHRHTSSRTLFAHIMRHPELGCQGGQTL